VTEFRANQVQPKPVKPNATVGKGAEPHMVCTFFPNLDSRSKGLRFGGNEDRFPRFFIVDNALTWPDLCEFFDAPLCGRKGLCCLYKM
jgi:hypothetical protein